MHAIILFSVFSPSQWMSSHRHHESLAFSKCWIPRVESNEQLSYNPPRSVLCEVGIEVSRCGARQGILICLYLMEAIALQHSRELGPLHTQG